MISVMFSLVLVLLFLDLPSECDGFVSPLFGTTPPVATTSVLEPFTVLNMAKKKRRRRKDRSSPSPPPPQPSKPPPEEEPTSEPPSDELPDFDFDDGNVEPSSPASDAPRERSAPANPKGQLTMNDLLSDRTLESKMEFDEPEMELPDLADFRNAPADVDLAAKMDVAAPQMGKKRARAEARREKAIAAKEQEESNILSSLPPFPFVGDLVGEDGKLQPLKVLEAGAWIGIFILLSWELYINSPFFDRAAPITPVVF